MQLEGRELLTMNMVGCKGCWISEDKSKKTKN